VTEGRPRLTRVDSEYSLLVALYVALYAPFIGVSARWPGVMHAISMEEVIDSWPGLRPGKRQRAVTAACGTRWLQLLGDGQGSPIAWPPRADSLPPGWSRCVACHKATGRKRPRSAWAAS